MDLGDRGGGQGLAVEGGEHGFERATEVLLDDPVERLRFLRPLFEITTEPPTAGIEPDDD